MASIRKDEAVRVAAARAWAALRDVGNPHRIFTPVLVDSSIEGDVRTVIFANGMIVRERIVDIDDELMRVAYAIIDGDFEHHSASMAIVPDGEARCRFVWISDFLPDAAMEVVEPLVEAGTQALVRNLEAAGAANSRVAGQT